MSDAITIKLDAKQWEIRQDWLAHEGERQKDARQFHAEQNQAMNPDHSTIVPAGGVWVCHGAWEFADFTDEDEEAQWPDEVIWQKCAPMPLIAWRVTNARAELGMPGSTPNLVLPDGEFEGNFTDVAFGNTPEAAIAQLRRLLTAKKAEYDARVLKCSNAGHTISTVRASTCHCGNRAIKFVRASDES